MVRVRFTYLAVLAQIIVRLRDGRWISNVSLAMPHQGIIAAASPANGLPRPQPLNNLGAFEVHAAISSPVINVMCVEMGAEELKPMVYNQWDGVYTAGENWTTWPDMAKDPTIIPAYSEDEWLNATVVDNLFYLGPTYGQVRPPVFPHLPKEYNTILNHTGAYTGRNGLWLLGAASNEFGSYALCSLRAYRTSACSTVYSSTSSGSTLRARCDDQDDNLQYGRVVPSATSGSETISLDWVDLAHSWGNAVALNTGITDGQGTNARLLTQMIPSHNVSMPIIPTIAEALAVMASGSLLMSTQHATFRQDKFDGPPYNDTIKADVQNVLYTAGIEKPTYQQAFYLVLILVFAGNSGMLVWLIFFKKGLSTDYTDPSNLFALSINSPPSHAFAGSCGNGPSREQYKARWFVNAEHDHLWISNEQRRSDQAVAGAEGYGDIELQASPVMQAYSRLSNRKSIL